jgi:hypothetical protein
VIGGIVPQLFARQNSCAKASPVQRAAARHETIIVERCFTARAPSDPRDRCASPDRAIDGADGVASFSRGSQRVLNWI